MKKVVSIFVAAMMIMSIFAVNVGASYDTVADKDANTITKAGILTAPITSEGYLLDSLTLPTEGANGSVITWKSSDESVITNDGSLRRPVSTDADVTLTAIVNDGTSTVKKSFDFKVASLNSQPAGTPKLLGTLICDDFNGDAVDSSYVSQKTKTGSVSVISNGLQIASAAAGDGVVIDTQSLKTYHAGGVYTEYVFAHRSNAVIQFRGYDASDSSINGWHNIWNFDIKMPSDNAVSFSTYDEESADKKDVLAEIPDVPGGFKIAVYNDISNQTYSAWINNVPVITDAKIPGYNPEYTFTGLGPVNITIASGEQYFRLESFRQYAADSDSITLSTKSGNDLLYRGFDVEDSTPGYASGANVSDGVLKNNAGNYVVSVYNANVDGTPNYNSVPPKSYEGVVGVEFELTRADVYARYDIMLLSGGGYGKYHSTVQWSGGNNKHWSKYKETSDAAAWVEKQISGFSSPADTTMKLKYLIDTRDGMLSVWINGKLVLDKVYSATGTEEAGMGVGGIAINANSGKKDFTIENLRIYNAVPPKSDRYLYDIKGFDDSLIETVAYNDINLPLSLPFGTSVSWSSDNEAVISNDGKVKRGAEDKIVNLTATVEGANGEPITKTFAVTVPKYQAPVYTAIDSDGYKADFYVAMDGGKHAGAVAYLVKYSGNKLDSIKIAKIAGSENDGTTPVTSLEYSAEEIGSESEISVKAFVWADEKLIPVSKSYNINN